jgi:hypothetical protein
VTIFDFFAIAMLTALEFGIADTDMSGCAQVPEFGALLCALPDVVAVHVADEDDVDLAEARIGRAGDRAARVVEDARAVRVLEDERAVLRAELAVDAAERRHLDGLGAAAGKATARRRRPRARSSVERFMKLLEWTVGKRARYHRLAGDDKSEDAGKRCGDSRSLALKARHVRAFAGACGSHLGEELARFALVERLVLRARSRAAPTLGNAIEPPFVATRRGVARRAPARCGRAGKRRPGEPAPARGADERG